MMRSALMTVASLALTTTVIGNAYFAKKQFYPSVVYITKSNPSMAIIYLQAFVFVLLMGKLMRKIFFGQLRAAEMEHLIERSWYAVTETCLAFTVFRDDLSPKFVALFTLLLFLKCFHWLAEDRVDYMERSPNISILFHFRVACLLLLLGILDLVFVSIAYQNTLTKGASVQLVFGFEYAILFTIVLNILAKYILHCIDMQSENPWDDKAVYLLYSELGLGLMKVVLYLTFITIMMKIHTFPLFAIRPMYLSMRSFKKALNDVIMSRRAINNMNTMYPNATAEELASSDNVCIICREEMVPNGTAKRLPCNHIFHVACLRSWFQRQQTCPTCRMDVLHPPPNAAGATPNVANLGGRNVPGAQGVPGRPGQAAVVLQPNPLLLAMPNLFQAMIQAQAQAQAQQQQQQQQNPTHTSASTQQANAQTQNQVPNQSPTSSASASSQQVPTSGTQGATMYGMPPLMAFPAPIPPPPLDLGHLSHEELQRMEGNERENIEARIRCLRNIQTMLDAAILQLQMYNTTLSAFSSPSVTPTHASVASPASATRPVNATSAAPTQQQAVSTSQSESVASASASSSSSANGLTEQGASSASTSSGLDAETIRQRRLQHLSSKNNAPTATQASNSTPNASGGDAHN